MLGVNGLCKQNSAEELIGCRHLGINSIIIGKYLYKYDQHSRIQLYTCTDSLTPSSLFLRPGKSYIVEIWHVDTVL